MCFLILALAFYWFFFCGKTFTSSAAQLLLLVTAILYGYGILASDMWVLLIHLLVVSSQFIRSICCSSLFLLIDWFNLECEPVPRSSLDLFHFFFPVFVFDAKLFWLRYSFHYLSSFPFPCFFIYPSFGNDITNTEMGFDCLFSFRISF